MRFLFGLIIGAMLTILAASVINAPTQVVVNDIREAWHELVDKVQQSEQSVSGTAEVRTEAKIEPNDWSAQDNLLEDNLLEDNLLEDKLLQLASQPPPETDVEVEASEILAIEQNVLTESSWPSSSYASQSSSATIWEPFHSQVSATGFAKRLSLQLGYPFQVTKDGPARYLVVFHYKSDEERALLVQQVATLTGYRAP
ncbi:MAG: hypothetical protein IH908_12205 [Proteobacteria bacterium]|nr:hypothetical protein [Pseudomonadota bacterium]